MTESKVITQTTAWIKSVVIGCNFCPFAAKAIFQNSIRYVVLNDATLESSLEALLDELRHLDETDDIETTLLIFPQQFRDFDDYLELVGLVEDLAEDQEYDGIYQIASFHPDYCFADTPADDPANYTNRSIYPMIHILREDSISQVLATYPDADTIPDTNIHFARQKGLLHMQLLRAACM